MKNDPTLIAVLGTLGAGLIAAISTILVNYINKKSEERKHMRQLAITAAIETHKQNLELVRLARKDEQVQVLPFEDHFVRIMKLIDLANNKNIDLTNIEEVLTELNQLTDKAIAYRQKRRNASTRP